MPIEETVLKPVRFSKVLRWIRINQGDASTPFTITTKRKHFLHLWVFGGCILVKGSHSKAEYIIDSDKWRMAMDRMKELHKEKKTQNKYYVRPELQVPENNFGPSCMIICYAFYDDQLI